uniref:Uncharacterized protein n=1 Tax=Plectus sambesii TaxID=2011161 RepID=A0A914VLX7_9BILA
NPVLDNSYSEYTETDDASVGRSDQGAASSLVGGWRQSGVAQIDARFFRPLFVRKFTAKEKKESTLKLTDMAMEWFKAAPQDSES